MRFLPDSRYFWRELLPRFVVLSMLFGCVFNFVPGLAFSGGILAACVLGLVFTAHFMVLGTGFFGWSALTNFVERNKSKLWLQPLMIVFVFIEPAAVLELAARCSFGALSIDGVFAALCASVLVNIGCAATHDWGR